ncbi:MAG TPA: FMN-binding protein [Lentimicrobium sp.]|nr:FMN-binding protein [Lentimicrobium sp.]
MKAVFVLVLTATLALGLNQTNYAPKQLLREIERISNKKEPQFSKLDILNGSQNPFPGGIYYIIENSLPAKYAYIGRVLTCRAEGCSIRNDKGSESASEFFDYFILYDSDASVLSVQVYNYEATHGHEITVRKWLKQFVDFDGTSKLIVGKNVDAIAGATISVHGITDDITLRTKTLKSCLAN